MPPIYNSSPMRVQSRILQWATGDFDDVPSWAGMSRENLAETAAQIRHSIADNPYRQEAVDSEGRPWVVSHPSGLCADCGGRPGYCTCQVCRECWRQGHASIRHWCDGCARATCHDDCRCGEEERPDRPTIVSRSLTYRGKKDGTYPRRYVGLELEISAWDDVSDVDYAARQVNASIVEDGSIGDGVELVTQPTRGGQLRRDLDTLLRSVTRADDSCGLHVHVDARDYGPWELRRLALLYSAVEPALHAIYPEREGARYCQRVSSWARPLFARPASTADLRSTLWALLYPQEEGRDIKSAKAEKYRPTRYKALNLHSWCLRKTVEFRLAAGTPDAAAAEEWAVLCAGMVDLAYRATDVEAEAWEDLEPSEVLALIRHTADPKRCWNHTLPANPR